jgi:hypothetical protein
MKCSIVRNRLLDLSDMGIIPENLQQHLDGCAGCKAWFAQLILVDKAIQHLPVPAYDAKAKEILLKKFRTPNEVSKPSDSRKSQPVVTPSTIKTPSWPLPEFVSRYWHAGLIAATLLIGTIAFLSLGGPSPVVAALPPDPLLNDLVDTSVALSKADSHEKRMTQLVAMADKLHTQIREIAHVDAEGENLTKLADLYYRVVWKGIVSNARNMPEPQQKALLPDIVKHLAEAGEQAAALKENVQQSAKEPLDKVIIDARDASKTIRDEILKGKT